MSITAARLADVLLEIDTALRRRELRYALAGGIAMAAHGLPRATRDLDLLVARTDAEAVDTVLSELGFDARPGAPGFVRYVRNPLPSLPELHEWVDVLIAERPLGLGLLAAAEDHPLVWQGHTLTIVPLHGLVLMKLLAMSDNPARLQDHADVVRILREKSSDLDLDALERAARELGPDIHALLVASREDAVRETQPIRRDSAARL